MDNRNDDRIAPRHIMAVCAGIVIANLLYLLAACSTTGPSEVAETPEQRAYAAYGTFVVYQEAGASLMQSESVPYGVKERIQSIDAEAKPIADNLLDAALALERVRTEYREGEAEYGAVATAVANVERWSRELQPVLGRLVEVVGDAL